MNITCPGCNTCFSADSSSCSHRGRTARCTRCARVWPVVPHGGDADILPPVPTHASQAVAARATGETAGEDRRDAVTARARLVDDGTGDLGFAGNAGAIGGAIEKRARAAARRALAGPFVRSAGISRRAVDVVVYGAVAAALVAAVIYRDAVVRTVPATAGLYELVGLQVNLRGLLFANITQRRDFEDGVPVLVIDGEIHNRDAAATAVPALRFALRGREGGEIYNWTVEPRRKVIGGASAMKFQTRLASPPQGADDVHIQFADREIRIVEYSQ